MARVDLAVLAMGLCAAVGCRSVKQPTEIVAVVTADIPLGDLGGIRFVVSDPAQPSSVPLGTPGQCTCLGDGAGCAKLPLSVGLIQGTGSPTSFAVHAVGFADPLCTQSLVEESAIVSFVDRHVLELDLFLGASCEHHDCPPGFTCSPVDGSCIDNHRPSLPPFSTADQGEPGEPADLGIGSPPPDAALASFDLAVPPDLSPPPPTDSCTGAAVAWSGANGLGKLVVACERWSGGAATIQGASVAITANSGTMGTVTPTSTLSGGAATDFHAAAAGSLLDGNVLVAWQDNLGAVGASLVAATDPPAPGPPVQISASGMGPAIATNYTVANLTPIGLPTPTQLQYLVVFRDRATGALAGALLDQQAKILDGPTLLSPPGAVLGRPAVAFDGTRYFVVWDDGQTVFGAHVGANAPLMPVSDTTALSAMDAKPRHAVSVICQPPPPGPIMFNPPPGCLVAFEEAGSLQLVFRDPSGKLSSGPLSQQAGARDVALTILPLFDYVAAWRYQDGQGTPSADFSKIAVGSSPSTVSPMPVTAGMHGGQVTPVLSAFYQAGGIAHSGFVVVWSEQSDSTAPFATRFLFQ
jgi:hypothetical protein